MSMQDGYLTLLAYDNALARRRKRRTRHRHRKMLGSMALFLLGLAGFVFVITGGAGLI